MKFTVANLRHELLGPVSFNIAAGEVLCLSGPSGCGKSMLLRCLADLEDHAGEVLLDDIPSNEISPPAWRRQVGLLPTDSQWWETTVGQHFPAPHHDSLFHALQTLGFSAQVMQWRIDRLSSGEKQRLAILRLLQNEPQVLLLDEPTANLDPASTARVEDYLLDYQRQSHCAILWVGHDMSQIRRLCTRHLSMQQGILHQAGR